MLDPCFCPAVAHQEPGGLSTRQLVDAIRALGDGDGADRGGGDDDHGGGAPPAAGCRVLGGDVVELLPARDTADALSARVAAKVVRELAAATMG